MSENAKSKEEVKEFVDGVMRELKLKGATKKRLVKTLAERYNYNRQQVLFKLKRALITERYQAHKKQEE